MTQIITSAIQTKNLTKMVNPQQVMKKQIQQAKNLSRTKNLETRGKQRILFDQNKFQLLSISCPVSIPAQTKSNRRYMIQIRYIQKGKKGIRNKQVLFGDKSCNQFIDHKDVQRKMLRIKSLKNTQNIFHPNHWRLMLLNRQQTVLQSYNKYLLQSGIAK